MREAATLDSPPAIRPTLESVRKRFQIWRKKGRAGRHVPEALWGGAVELCRDHPVSRVCRILRLDYYGLRDRVHKSQDAGSAPDRGFVKFDLGAPLVTPSEWRVEMEAPNGAKMTLSVKGVPREVEPLEWTRAFWGQGR